MSAENENKLSGSQWGRVLICGGTDWTRLGRRDRSGAPVNDEEDAHPDLLEPHILRSLSNVKITSVHTGCAACHFVALDVDGNAWLWGRNGSSCLGVSSSSTKASAGAGSKPIVIDAISENAPMKINPVQDLGAQEGTKFVDATCGRNHTLLVGSDGQVWTAGTNTLGQCGHAPCPEIAFFKPVLGFGPGSDEEEHAVKVSAGITFSLVLTQSGKVFSFGSGEKGQLGNGATGERITTGNKVAFDVFDTPYYIKELDGKKIVQISSGQQHSAAIDDEGNVYVWGYNGYCRLGLGNQTDVLKPKPVPQFAAPTNGSSKDNHNNNKDGKSEGEGVGMATVVCGPSNTVVVDRNGMYWMAGKWKNSGEGSSGSPYSSFRIIQDIMACKVNHAACGGVTHWLVTPNDDENEKTSANGTGVATMTVAWGQNASNGELGLGPDEPKSSTKPTKHIPLDGIEVLQIAAGQNTTAFLVKPTLPLASQPSAIAVDGDATGNGEGEDSDGDKYSNLPRHPEQVEDVPDFCLVCNKDHGEDDSPLECEKCDNPYHLGCLSPPLSSVPPGEWFCPKCVKDPGAPLARFKAIRPSSGGGPSAGVNAGGGASRMATPADQDVDMQDVNGTGSRRSKSKRKASGSGEGGGRGGAKKKRQ